MADFASSPAPGRSGATAPPASRTRKSNTPILINLYIFTACMAVLYKFFGKQCKFAVLLEENSFSIFVICLSPFCISDNHQPNQFECHQIDECSIYSTECSVCISNNTTFCVCNPGFESNNFHCVNIDECDRPTHNCSVNANCVDSEGSYSCVCNEGFEGDGQTCQNVNECEKPDFDCPLNSMCVDTVGSYECVCKQGFENNDGSCVDINECMAENNCSVNADCHNIQGSYNCTCTAGYIGNGEICTDIDECSAMLDNCSPNATCSDTVGSYMCVCNAGFTGDGLVCDNINECESGTAQCSEHAQCHDNDGSYSCTCNHGYIGDGFQCTRVVVCPPGSFQHVDGSCVECPLNTYNDRDNVVLFECFPCPTGFTTARTGSVSSLQCECKSKKLLHCGSHSSDHKTETSGTKQKYMDCSFRPDSVSTGAVH